jgi:hypothetical protein
MWCATAAGESVAGVGLLVPRSGAVLGGKISSRCTSMRSSLVLPSSIYVRPGEFQTIVKGGRCEVILSEFCKFRMQSCLIFSIQE